VWRTLVRGEEGEEVIEVRGEGKREGERLVKDESDS